MENSIKILDKLIRESLKSIFNQIDDKKTGILFSAGVDSTLLAKTCQSLGFKPLLISLITATSKDISFIKKISKYLNLQINIYQPPIEDFPAAIKNVRAIIKELGIDDNLMQVSLGVCNYFLFRFIKNLSIKSILSGQGSDELFAGYHKFRLIEKKDINRKIEKEYERLLNIDVKRDKKLAELFNLELYYPYLDEKIVKFALDLPIKYKITNIQNKIIIRNLALSLGVPEYISYRPKKAMQYSTGIQKIVKKML